jgi:hypothetical protein
VVLLTGLAWTSVGELLNIEALRLPGKVVLKTTVLRCQRRNGIYAASRPPDCA